MIIRTLTTCLESLALQTWISEVLFKLTTVSKETTQLRLQCQVKPVRRAKKSDQVQEKNLVPVELTCSLLSKLVGVPHNSYYRLSPLLFSPFLVTKKSKTEKKSVP